MAQAVLAGFAVSLLGLGAATSARKAAVVVTEPSTSRVASMA